MTINSPNLIPCPAKRCEKTFYCDENLISVHNRLPEKDGMCDCNNIICFRCKLDGHEPLDCSMMESWKKNIDMLSQINDQLNKKWKETNTKQCPSCKADIEKNFGCMHMTCRNCSHEFCWLCLGNWSIHGSKTGGYYECNLYKPDEHKDDGEDNDEKKRLKFMKRIQFYTDRYFSQKSACELIKKKIEEIDEKFSEDGTDVSKFNKESNGGLNFYRDAYSSLVQCRNFVMNSYAVSYQIVQIKNNFLFTQTQSMLTHALETFNKFLESTPIENFITVKGDFVFHSETFSDKKAELLDLQNTLKLQFKGAQTSFCSAQFREAVKEMFKNASVTQINWYGNEGHEQVEEAVDLDQPPVSWYCSCCTFWNDNNLDATCAMCGMNGRPNVE